MYREQKTRHYWQNLQRHRVFATKECIANRKTGITGKILQRHRLFGSKECVANRKPAITGKICNDTGYSPQKSVSRTEKPSLQAKFCSDTDFSAQKSVSRAAALSFRIERVCRGQGGFKRVCRMETVCRVRYRWASGRLQAGSMRQASQQEPPCGISQKDKGCGQGGGQSRRP